MSTNVTTPKPTCKTNVFFDVNNVTTVNVNYSKSQFNASLLLQTELIQLSNAQTNSNDQWSQVFEALKDCQNLLLIILFCLLIVITIIGNTLVILAVLTTRRLKTVTNCFVMSLAVADLLVGIFVMPPAVAVHLKGSWQLGWILCDIWISLDVLLCTASILSLCAISVDRYLAIIQPLTYSRKRRSKRLALIMILIVWALALTITCPPMFGWYEPGRRYLNECRYNQNKGYVIFSAMGSFFIPMAVMIYVYGRIYCVVASRHDNMVDNSVHNKCYKRYTSTQTELNMDDSIFEQELCCNQNRQSAGRTLSNQTIVREIHELVELSESDLIAKSGSFELAVKTSANHRCKSSGLKSQNTYTVITRNTRVHNQKNLSNRISLLKKENKTTQTLSIVVGGFIACWLPFFIYYLLTPFLNKQQVSPNIAKVLTWLGWFNSAINPFIYAFYSVDFRAAFWRLTLKRLFRTSLKARYPPNTISIR